MSDQSTPGYSFAQIGLHWIIAALVLFQLIFGESMNLVLRAARRGTPVSASEQWWGDAHYWVGIAILALVIVRLGLRLAVGAPEFVQSDWTAVAARLVHVAFYALLVATPILGLLGFYLGEPWDDVHALSKPVFIVLIALHVGAVLYHQLWLRDGTLRRMVVPAT